MPSSFKDRRDYQALQSDDSLLSDDKGVESRITTKKGQQQWHVIRLLLAEGVLFLLLFAAYVFSVSTSRLGHNQHDEYFKLGTYNVTKTFTEDFDLMEQSVKADQFWSEIQSSDGVVSVPTEWATRLDLAPSLPSPEDPDHSIYQVDLFHSLHCLYRFRNLLVSKVPLDVWPRDTNHTLHCLNFMRQQIICHSDITLQGTDDYLHFTLNRGHVCRDDTALRGWVAARHLEGHRQWVKDNVGVE